MFMGLLLLAGCNAPPPVAEAPVSAVAPGAEIDTSGSFAKGFNRGEALRLLELCLNLNNADDGPDFAADTSAWEPVYPATADARVADLGPFHNAWKLWRSKTEDRTYAIVVRGTIADKGSILEDVIATSVTTPARTTCSSSSAQARRESRQSTTSHATTSRMSPA